MTRFNLDNYVTVDERIRRFYAEHRDDGAILTAIVSMDEHVIVQATVTRNGDVWAQGLARGPLRGDKALEKIETTAIGRALANAGYVKEGEERPSREEMADVEEQPSKHTVEERLLNAVKEAAWGYTENVEDHDRRVVDATALVNQAIEVHGAPTSLDDVEVIKEWFNGRLGAS